MFYSFIFFILPERTYNLMPVTVDFKAELINHFMSFFKKPIISSLL